MPLVLPVHLVCNTSDELLYCNIYENSRVKGDWLRLEDPHRGVAILCGSGPSLADSLSDIRKLVLEGGTVFALNGAATYLASNDIYPDYQVLMDAREETAELIGPAHVHLFASQVHPSCFDAMPRARIWHLQIGGIDYVLPDYERSYCLIGGAASVGNTTTCLAYAMGYRTLEIFGYDSSHRDARSHAFHQKMNDGEPCASVRFNGKDYISSLTMKLQAEKFQDTARALKEGGCVVNVHGTGLLPDIYNTPPMAEQDKYQAMWAHKEYRTHSPGERVADQFCEIAKPEGHVIDFGSGSGRGGARIDLIGDAFVTMVDFANNALDPEVQARVLDGLMDFKQADLTQPIIGLSGDCGYCADVMEHIPPADVDAVLQTIFTCVPKCFFQISLIPDSMGILIGQQLHLSVFPFEWWLEKLVAYGQVVHSQDNGHAATFYITQPLEE